MDGARFANALVSLDATPAEMTWKRGVDVLSFGGTKNGCWCAEAIVLFDPAQAAEMAFIRKRAAQLYSKSRFIAAQFHAYFEDGLWLETARHANSLAARLAGRIRESSTLRLAWEPEANEVFAIMTTAEPATGKGVFFGWHTRCIAASSPRRMSRASSPASPTAEDVDAGDDRVNRRSALPEDQAANFDRTAA